MSGTRWLWIGARLCMAAVVAVALLAALLRVFDFDALADYGEGTLLPMVERLRAEPMRPAWLDAPPYTLTSYGPAYYWATLGAGRLLPWRESLIPGRLVSLAATLATALVVALVVGRRARSGMMGAAAAVFYLSSPLVHSWGTVHRVDPLATLLAILAYVVLPVARWGVPAAAVCVVLGSLVKQSVCLTVVPLAAYLLLERRWRSALLLAALTALLGAAVWLALDRHSGGYLFRTAVEGNVGRMWARQGFWAGYDFLAAPLGLGAALLVGYRLVERGREALRSIWAVGFLVAMAIASAMSAKEGAAPLYFLEASALAALVVGAEGLLGLWSLHRGRAAALALVLVAAAVAPQVRYVRSHGLRLDSEPYCGRLIAAALGPGRGQPILVDGQHIAAVMQAGWTPLLNDSFRLRLLIDGGHMRPDGVIQAIDQRRVEFLVLKRPLGEHRQQIGSISQKWPAEILDAMARRFELQQAEPDRFVFIYRLKPAAAR